MKQKKKLIEGLPYGSDIMDLAIKLKLTPYERLLLLNLRLAMNEKNKRCWLKQTTLALRMGVSRWTVNKALKRLKHLGVLRLSKKKNLGKFNNTIYEFIYPWRIQEIAESPCVSQQHDSCSPCVSHRVGVTHMGDSHVAGTHTNKQSSTNKAKKEKINQSINRDGMIEKSKTSKNMKETERKESENLKVEISADSSCFKEVFRGPATKEQLKKFYNGKVPAPINLTVPPSNGKGNLSPLIKPFRNAGILRDLHGQDFDELLPEIYEQQIDNFYKNTIALFWKYDNPGTGFEVSFKRCCRSGAMSRNGLHFKTPQEIEKEQMRKRAEAQAKAQEARKTAEERALKEANHERERQEATQEFERMCEEDQLGLLEDHEVIPARFRGEFTDFLIARTSMFN